MLKLDRISCWIFIISFILLIPSNQLFKYADELIALSFLFVAVVDCFFNKNWSRYKLLWIIIMIFLSYAVYTLLFLHFNTPKYVLTDLLLQIKPYLPLTVMFAIAPKFALRDKEILKIVAIVNVVISALILVSYYIVGKLIVSPVFHIITNAGTTIFVSAIIYMYCSIKDDGSISIQNIIIVVISLLSGLMCTRSKYYGEFVLAIFFLFFYRPGILKNLNIKHAALMISCIVIFIAVGWSKFEFYFIEGSSDFFNPNILDSFARPVLYATSGLILVDYFPFGTGLASFASFPSAEHYSNLYYEYGLDKVWGLSPEKPDFICDAFYPSLAQFGVAGVIMFIIFWVYIYKYIKALLRYDKVKYKYVFCTGVLLICFLLIESIASTAITQNCGMMATMFIGFICGQGKDLMQTEKLIDDGKI